MITICEFIRTGNKKWWNNKISISGDEASQITSDGNGVYQMALQDKPVSAEVDIIPYSMITEIEKAMVWIRILEYILKDGFCCSTNLSQNVAWC